MAGTITNSGLDNFCTNNANAGEKVFTAAFDYAAVTADSTPIVQTSTALTAELARTNANGGFTGSANCATAGNTITATITYTRIINFASAQNLAAWGLFSVSSGGNMSAGDLFRDGTNTPVSVSVLAGGQLQLTITLTYAVAMWGASALNINITGVGAVAGQHTLYKDVLYDAFTLSFIAAPNPTSIGNNYLSATTDAAPSTNPLVIPSTQLLGVVQSLDAYTAGSYSRSRRATFATSQANGNITAFMEQNQSGTAPGSFGYKFILSAALTKASTQQLTLVTTWSVTRA